MAGITFRAEDLRDPFDSARILCRIEPAEDCDGLACGATGVPFDVLGIYPKPHFHLVAQGEEPPTTPRYSPQW